MRAQWWMSFVHLLGFVAASVAWIAVLGGALAALAMLRPDLLGGSSLDALLAGGSAEILAWFTIAQFVGIGAIALAGGAALAREGGGLAPTLGLRSAAAVAFPLAIGVGLTGGVFPAWVVEQLGTHVPGLDPVVNDFVVGGLTGDARTRFAVSFAIAVAAPLAEELAFRGYLWAAFERYTSSAVAFAVTSTVFALYHVDPGQVLGVFPIALTLGWARWWTRSIWPCIALHAVNNGLALAVVAAAPELSPEPTPAWIAFAGLGVTLACCAGLWATRGATIAAEAP